MANVYMCGCMEDEMLNTEEGNDENLFSSAAHDDSPIEIHFPNACMIQERTTQCKKRINSPPLSRSPSQRP